MSESFSRSIQQLYKTSIQTAINNCEVQFTRQINDLLEKIADHFSLDILELRSLVDKPTESSSPIKTLASTSSSSSQSSNTDGKVCQHQFTSGKNKGQKCGDKVCAESKTGLFCKTHVKKEDKNMFLKDVPPASSRTKDDEPKKEQAPKAEVKTIVKKKDPDAPLIPNTDNIKKLISERTGNISVKKNKWGRYEHEASHLILDPISKEAINKQNPDGTLSELTRDDIDLAKTLGFKVRIPSNLTSTRASKSEQSLYDDDEDEEYLSDVEDSDED